eukprot:jgi/Picsp_1/250/NSC_00249-R1_---NA---
MNTLSYILLFEIICCFALAYSEGIGSEKSGLSIPPGIPSQLCGSKTVDTEDAELLNFNITAEYNLEGHGAHRVLRYKLFLTTRESDLDTVSSEHFQSLAVVHPLPSLIFIDPYDTKRLTSGLDAKHFRSKIIGDVDLESIGSVANPKGVTHLLVVDDIRNVCGWTNGSLQTCNIDVGIKINFRYPLVSRSDVVFWSNPLAWVLGNKISVRLESFDVYTWGLRQIDKNRGKHLCVENTISLVNLNIIGEKYLETDLPAGAERHIEFVRLVTIITLILSCIRIMSI